MHAHDEKKNINNENYETRAGVIDCAVNEFKPCVLSVLVQVLSTKMIQVKTWNF